MLASTDPAGVETPRLELVRLDDNVATIPDGPDHIRSAQARGYPEVRISPIRPEKCIIVAGGRSILQFKDKLKELYEQGHYFLAINKVHDWLIENGMPPHGQILYEVGPLMHELQLKLHPDVEYLCCSICDPGTFEAIEGYKVRVWHPQTRDEHTEAAISPNSHVIAGGGTTFGRSIPLALVMGFRSFEIFGAESSYEGQSHFNGTPGHVEPLEVKAVTTTGEERTFMSAPYFVMQANDMRELFKRHHFMFKCRFHGDGLLPWLHKTMFPEQYEEANGL